MATILKKQRSLYLSALKYIALAFLVAIAGRLLLPVHVFITIATLIAFPLILGKSFNFLLGALGEHLVTKEICKLGDDYYLFNDINLPGMQIDHTLICPKGIITIETKTYFGKVYGNGDDKYWKQYLNGVSIRRYSPIRQGRCHSVKLHDLLEPKGLSHRIDTIVVFAGLAKVSVNPKPIPVLYRKEINEYIIGLPDMLSSEQIQDYKGLIMNEITV